MNIRTLLLLALTIGNAACTDRPFPSPRASNVFISHPVRATASSGIFPTEIDTCHSEDELTELFEQLRCIGCSYGAEAFSREIAMVTEWITSGSSAAMSQLKDLYTAAIELDNSTLITSLAAAGLTAAFLYWLKQLRNRHAVDDNEEEYDDSDDDAANEEDVPAGAAAGVTRLVRGTADIRIHGKGLNRKTKRAIEKAKAKKTRKEQAAAVAQNRRASAQKRRADALAAIKACNADEKLRADRAALAAKKVGAA
jgi:hypothetical protein